MQHSGQQDAPAYHTPWTPPPRTLDSPLGSPETSPPKQSKSASRGFRPSPPSNPNLPLGSSDPPSPAMQICL
eukprot:607561-Prorocentrum_minimum.AAC.4